MAVKKLNRTSMPTFMESLDALLRPKNKKGTPAEVEFDTVPSFESKSQQGRFAIRIKDDWVAGFALVCLPGCCGILVSTGAAVASNYQGLGVGTLLNEMRVQIAHEWGYSLLLATNVTENEKQKKIFTKNGWTNHLAFLNGRTTNWVNLHTSPVKHIRPLGFILEGV